MKLSPKWKTLLDACLTLVLVMGAWHWRGYVENEKSTKLNEIMVNMDSEISLSRNINLLKTLRSGDLERGLEMLETSIDSKIIFLDEIYSEALKKQMSQDLIPTLKIVQAYRTENPRMVDEKFGDNDNFGDRKMMAKKAQEILQSNLPGATP